MSERAINLTHELRLKVLEDSWRHDEVKALIDRHLTAERAEAEAKLREAWEMADRLAARLAKVDESEKAQDLLAAHAAWKEGR